MTEIERARVVNALKEEVASIVRELPYTEEAFQALRSPSRLLQYRNFMAQKILTVRRGAGELGDVSLLRDVHTLLAELQSVEGTVQQLGPLLHTT